MAAFNSKDFSNASVETDTYVHPVTTYGITAMGMLFTAYYSAPNTLTLQFSSYDPAVLTAASSSTTNYTLSGPSAPSVTAVTFSPGGRTFTLTLSGPLSSVNTYTLAIADLAVSNGEQPNFSGLVVDVIMPIDLACVGVGIQQDVVLGAPSVQMAGTAQEVGIQQDVSLGTPAISTIIAAIGQGVAISVDLGNPSVGLFVTAVGVGFVQATALGTPIATRSAAPVGVGIAQAVDFGTPVATINPLTPTGVGVSQAVQFGNPVATGSSAFLSFGIIQLVSLGAPVVVKTNTQSAVGVGIAQPIALGTPAPYASATMVSDPFDQTIDVGTPRAARVVTDVVGVGIAQAVALGLPVMVIVTPVTPLTITLLQAAGMPDLDAALQKAFGFGVDGAVTSDLINKIEGYVDLNDATQHLTKVVFEDVAAAFLVSTNLPGVLPSTNSSDNTALAKTTDLGANGSLTWVDGILVAKVNPT